MKFYLLPFFQQTLGCGVGTQKLAQETLIIILTLYLGKTLLLW